MAELGDVSNFDQVAKKFGDELNAWLEKHDRELHDGKRCESERANILAYIAHRIGYTTETFQIMVEYLELYTDYHEEHVH